MIGRLIDAAPRLVVLATSREPLRLRAEREFPVASAAAAGREPRLSLEEALDLPGRAAVRGTGAGGQTRVRAGRANVADVVAICRRLDGLPLAIELAAARVRILTPAALLARLDQRLAILTGGARDLPARQQTLRAAIAWSYDLLVLPERALFARLAVFAGRVHARGAEAVCGAAGGLPLDLLDGIDSLVQKSLLRQEEGPGGDPRFTMLETIREFAQERLHELPEARCAAPGARGHVLALAENVDRRRFLRRSRSPQPARSRSRQFSPGDRVLRAARCGRPGATSAPRGRPRPLLEDARASRRRPPRARGGDRGRGDIPPAQCAPAIKGAALLAEAQGDLEGAER